MVEGEDDIATGTIEDGGGNRSSRGRGRDWDDGGRDFFSTD